MFGDVAVTRVIPNPKSELEAVVDPPVAPHSAATETDRATLIGTDQSPIASNGPCPVQHSPRLNKFNLRGSRTVTVMSD
jgi:hypothetical protein